MDHPNPDITAPDGGAPGEPLEGAVRERILRLHPLGGDGGLSGKVMRKALGWDQAKSFAAEVMGRFRSPFAVTPLAMPLALPAAESRIPATGSASVPATPSVHQRQLPVVDSSPSGTVGSGSLVQRKVMGGSDSPPLAQSIGTVPEPFYPPEKLAEGFHKNIVGSDNYESKADVSPKLKSPPTAAGTWAMTARLHSTLGTRLVQRHSGFVGVSPEAEAGVVRPLSGQKMSMAASESPSVARANKVIGRTAQRKTSGETESGTSIVDQFAAATSALGADSHVSPPSLGRAQDVAATSGKSDAVRLQPEPFATAQPLVKAIPPARLTLQRKGGAASLANDIFARLPNSSSGAAIPSLPLPFAAPEVDRSGPAMDSLSSSSMTTPSGAVSQAAAASSTLFPPPKGAPPAGTESGQGLFPVIPRSPSAEGVSGVVSRKVKDTVPGPELPWGGPRVGASETLGAAVFPRADHFSLPRPSVSANISGSAFSAPLPLVQSRGVAGSDAGERIQRKPANSLPVAQRSEAAGSSATAISSNGTSDSATGFSLGASPETGALTPTPGASVDLEQVADEVYRIIERRLIVEKENRGL